jgi:hypothetical protein
MMLFLFYRQHKDNVFLIHAQGLKNRRAIIAPAPLGRAISEVAIFAERCPVVFLMVNRFLFVVTLMGSVIN